MKRGAWVSGGVGLLVAVLGAVALAGSGGSDGGSRPSPPADFRVDGAGERPETGRDRRQAAQM